MYNAISLTNKNETKCGLQNKNYAKMSLHFHRPKRDETKCYNVILSRFVALLLLFCSISLTSGADRFAQQNPPNCYSKLALSHFEGGSPVKFAFQGHVIGVTSTRGHEKQPAATVLK